MSHVIRLFLVLTLGVLQPGMAMQLGASKGSAVFGRPLDLTVPIRFDAPVEDPLKCFDAEIFQADTKFDAGRVRIDVTPAANGMDAVVRIRSNTAVVEPWAKVILRNNCGAKVTRQYDFLTDFVADMPANTPQTETVATNNLPNASIVGSTTPKQSTQAATVSNALPVMPSAPVSNWSVKRAQTSTQSNSLATNQASAQAPSKPRHIVQPKAAEPTATATAAAPANSLGKVAQLGQSRLKMETFELTDEHQVLLKLSTAMIAPTGMRTPEEIQALTQATAVWRAINGMPALTSTAAAATVAETTPTLAASTVATGVTEKVPAIAGNNKIDFSNPIIYGLLGLLALTLACIAWLWLHVRRGTQPGYGWLKEKELMEEPMQTEPSPFSVTSYKETPFAPQEPVAEIDEPISTNVETPSPRLTEAALDTNPSAILLSNKDKEAEPQKHKKTSPEIIANGNTHSEFSTANEPEKSPAHFDDSRFDERHLNAQSITSRPVHDRPITSPTELMDLVMDTLPKLRSVPSPTPVLDDIFSEALLETKALPQKPSTSSPAVIPKPETKTEGIAHKIKEAKAETKIEPKGNLIDFEIFAAPIPPPKRSRSNG